MFKKITAIIIMILGVLLMIYPRLLTEYNSIINRFNEKKYIDKIGLLTSDELVEKIDRMLDYNEETRNKINQFNIDNQDPFGKFINTEDTRLMKTNYNEKNIGLNNKEAFAYLIIPKIKEVLPIYLDATEENLFSGVANLSGTSIPIGEKSSHSVIAGHRGYYKSNIFRYIDNLNSGDTFHIYIYGNRLDYVVVKKDIILPYELDSLRIVEGKDYVTLLSCHPFPYNSHRITIRGERIFDSNIKLEIDDKIERINYQKDLNNEFIENIWNNKVEPLVIMNYTDDTLKEEFEAKERVTNTVGVSAEVKRSKIINYSIIIICSILLIILIYMLYKEIKIGIKNCSKKYLKNKTI